MSESDRETIMWKVEPLSPSGTPPLEYDYEDEKWLFLDQKPAIPEASGLEESGLYDEQLTRAQVASKFLEELELKNWIKEESFADWFEEKIDIPIFEDLPAPECGQNRAAVIYTSLPKPQPIVQQHQQQQVVLSHHQAHHHQQQQQQQQQHQHVDATQSLLREFETVLGDVEACHQITSMVSTLTPPQSPPPNIKQHHQQQQQQAALVVPNAHLLVSLQPLHHQNQAAFLYEQQHQQHHQESVASVPSAHSQRVESYTVLALPVVQQQQQQPINDHWNAENLSLVPLGHINDVVHELAKVDEYVLNCAANVGPSADSSSANHLSSALSSSSSRSSSSSSTASHSSPPSPCTSSNASCISSEDSADDPDWSYEPVPSSSASSSGRRSSQTGRSGRRTSGSKPYSRPNAEDKRVRKKEQNKNAATRYRQKKKQEVKEILGEERELVDRNDKLQAQLKDLQREIGYLKGLMRDLFKAKGLIK